MRPKHTLKTGIVLLLLVLSACNTEPELYRASDFLPEGTFATPGMEGPATDRNGNLYAVSYGRLGTIGKVSLDGEHRQFVDLSVVCDSATANGIRFGADGAMYVAEYKCHHILRIDPASGQIEVFVHAPQMNQPNDLAMSPRGSLYASDPKWADSTGNLWLITPHREVLLLESGMGTTNGVEVSPDGKTLYVNESVQRTVWKYRLLDDGTLADKQLFYQFEDFGMDGMRCDVKGNLYITRHGKGTIAVLSPKGELVREISLKGKLPSNLTFGGKDNRTCYVTMADRGCFEMFRVEFPGRE